MDLCPIAKHLRPDITKDLQKAEDQAEPSLPCKLKKHMHFKYLNFFTFNVHDLPNNGI